MYTEGIIETTWTILNGIGQPLEEVQFNFSPKILQYLEEALKGLHCLSALPIGSPRHYSMSLFNSMPLQIMNILKIIFSLCLNLLKILEEMDNYASYLEISLLSSVKL
jgi:hypothetical protein